MSGAPAPEPYSGFDTMAVEGQAWTGSSDIEYQNVNPYDDTPLGRIRFADAAGVESAYRAAAAAQPIVRAESGEDALRIANDTGYGLSSAVFTEDVERGVLFARRVRVGMTHVNDTTVNDEPNTAFGGEKGSGVGRFGGEWAIEGFTTDHWVSVQHTARALPFGEGE